MKKIINLFPPFQINQMQEVQHIIKQIFGNSKHDCEIIILHSCNNPQCPMGTIYGIIGSEEDEIMAINFAIDQIDKEERDLRFVMKNIIALPENKLKQMTENN